MFGQDHVARMLLGWDDGEQSHDAVRDAQKSMRLFNLYNQYQQNSDQWKQAQVSFDESAPPLLLHVAVDISALLPSADICSSVQELLLSSAPAPSFARRHPTFEGVCMGNRKSCTCGAPFLG